MKKIHGLFAAGALFVSMSAHAVLIDFEGLPAGTVVTNQFAGVTFSGGNTVLAQGRPLGNFICTSGCIANTILDFTTAVNNLSFWGIQIDATGKVAQFDIFQNGVLSASVDLIGPGEGDVGGGSRDTFIDLSAYTNVTRLAIVNILNNVTTENGIGWDQFRFDVGAVAVPEPTSLALLGVGLVVLGAARRRHARNAS